MAHTSFSFGIYPFLKEEESSVSNPEHLFGLLEPNGEKASGPEVHLPLSLALANRSFTRDTLSQHPSTLARLSNSIPLPLGEFGKLQQIYLTAINPACKKGDIIRMLTTQSKRHPSLPLPAVMQLLDQFTGAWELEETKSYWIWIGLQQFSGVSLNEALAQLPARSLPLTLYEVTLLCVQHNLLEALSDASITCPKSPDRQGRLPVITYHDPEPVMWFDSRVPLTRLNGGKKPVPISFLVPFRLAVNLG